MSVKASIAGLDRSLEPTVVTLNMPDVTALNFDAQSTALETVRAAIAGVSLIAFTGKKMYAVDVGRETAQPASVYAQREHKWLITMSDNVNGRINTFEIGGADLTLATVDGKTLDATVGAGLALKNAFEAELVSRDGNAMTYVSGLHVGRNT